ncbi:hypothetical protein BDV38DRAFT_281836 [Aspergillus pseudotamarii]|uniref:FAD-binding domain-containing protein n=1 Tax=Aspergillus pseudotamarii TaxID=132259 RepID=A0A5N6SX91_ASPPS|nr:uncharacterized protein BDV38DRAFT_281836 [Aspergillus pseudotamarii]KAE8138527.1 hypothetical protein BDV38DRAFT_281836 [Aspergillus pseudotamarii]
MTYKDSVSVAIIGGGIAGMTLANILEQAGISYILWEAYHQVAPPAGASVGLMPNGLRVLDQIGILDEVEHYMVPHVDWEHRDGDGTLYCTQSALRLLPKALGYSTIFMERQRLLEILFDNIRDKTTVCTGKRVSLVENFDTHALVTATDGTQVRCQFVAGADGVHSVVRQAIEAACLADLRIPEDYFATKISCVYGISDPLPPSSRITAGRNFTIYQASSSLLLFTGRNGVIYWFIFSSLDTTIPYSETKRYGDGDIEVAFARVAHIRVTPAVTFAEVFRNRRTAVMTPLEEGIALRWAAGRMVLMGDAAHKMVPHAAMGANQAMESAACFASRLLELRAQLGGCNISADLPPLVSPVLVEACLEGYVQKRKPRIEHVVKGASLSCRIQLKIGDAAQKHIPRLPSLGDERWLEELLKMLYKAEKIEPWDVDSERMRYYSEQAQKRCGSVKRILDNC